jgi:hypothetical protein
LLFFRYRKLFLEQKMITFADDFYETDYENPDFCNLLYKDAELKREVLESIDFLTHCEAEEAVALKEALDYVVHAPVPTFCIGKAAVLNPLLEWLRQHPEQNADLLSVIGQGRRLLGQERRLFGLDGAELTREEEKHFAGEAVRERRSYMATFMRTQRTRETRAANIENMMRPESKRLVGKDRNNFMTRMAKEWSQRRSNMLEELKTHYPNGVIPRAVKDEACVEFWERIDGELDAKEEKAQGSKK